MHMYALGLLVLFALASLASSAQPSDVTVFTSLILSTGFGAGRTPTVATRTVLFTSTLPSPSATSTGNSSASSNSTLSASASRNATSASSTTSNLPTAPTTVVAGGIGGVAPSPGEHGGPFGPPDGYIAAATALKRNVFLVGLGGCIIGGILVVF